MRSVSAVSCQSQIIARIETSGNEAIRPPTSILGCASMTASEASTGLGPEILNDNFLDMTGLSPSVNNASWHDRLPVF